MRAQAQHGCSVETEGSGTGLVCPGLPPTLTQRRGLCGGHVAPSALCFPTCHLCPCQFSQISLVGAKETTCHPLPVLASLSRSLPCVP